MVKKQFSKKSSAFFIAALIMVVFTAFFAVSAYALTDTTRPTILSVSPANNEKDISRIEQVTVVFSEAMNPSTINANTVTVMQRSTPELGVYRATAIEGEVTYAGRTATFTSNALLSPNQQYGNVFTVTITSGAEDLAGNSLSRNYVWSFTTGKDPFYTDATTSQLDQSPAPISGSVVAATPTQPSIVAAPTTAPVATAFPWAWLIGGLLALLLIALLFALATNRKTVKETSPAKETVIVKGTNSNPFGDVHPVIDLEGIGPEYNEKLQEMGIKNTKQLWEADAFKVARETGAPLSSVKSWQHMAELASVKDIGPQYAELLERSGIHSIAQLKNYNPNKLLKLIKKKQNSLKINIQGNHPGNAMVEHWIDEANDHKYGTDNAA